MTEQPRLGAPLDNIGAQPHGRVDATVTVTMLLEGVLIPTGAPAAQYIAARLGWAGSLACNLDVFGVAEKLNVTAEGITANAGRDEDVSADPAGLGAGKAARRLRDEVLRIYGANHDLGLTKAQIEAEITTEGTTRDALDLVVGQMVEDDALYLTDTRSWPSGRSTTKHWLSARGA